MFLVITVLIESKMDRFYDTFSQELVMKYRLLLALCLSVAVLPQQAEARGRRSGGGGYSTTAAIPAGHTTATAQGVANIMAATGLVGHWGGHHPYFEGCACGATQEQAYHSCCYAGSSMKTVDYGYARNAVGTWFCCRRYQ